ncbi:hypothetical protein PF001_g29070 [Phytophthora fragariae]|uniref:Uncharacterized protein n=1 Tax=Phytophthora fragariae TaxID=53985 RepID=A0A6A4B8S9_9STRA|nr:hypothetical protein PF001_g29070 [Phytophthora fragariae]
MVHLKHSAIHWRVRCVLDTPKSEDENTPPNVVPEELAKLLSGPSSNAGGDTQEDTTSITSTGTSTPPWLPPGTSQLGLTRAQTNPSPTPRPRSPTTSSPVMLDTLPRPPLRELSPLSPRHERRQDRHRDHHRDRHQDRHQERLHEHREDPRQDRRHDPRQERLHERRDDRRVAATPYCRPRVTSQQPKDRRRNPPVSITSKTAEILRPSRASAPGDVMALAKWPSHIPQLRAQFDPLNNVFPIVPHFGWCSCSSRCRNAKMNLFCNANCCPFNGLCGNGLAASDKICLMRNTRTS